MKEIKHLESSCKYCMTRPVNRYETKAPNEDFKNFDEEFKFIVEKKEIEKDPYSSKMRSDFLSEKSLLTQLRKEFKNNDQQKQQEQQPNKNDKPLSKQEMEEAIRMGTKLADLETLHNLESRTKASLDKDNPYSTERRKDFLSEKSLADRMSKTLGELAKINKKLFF